MSDNLKTDEELYTEYLTTGAHDALNCLVERHSKPLLFFLKGIVKSHEDAEDMVIETFAQLLSRNKHFRGNSSFKTWLFAIGRNQALKFLHKNRNTMRNVELITTEPEETDDDPPDLRYFSPAVSHDFTPEEQILNEEQRQQTLDTIAKLPDDYREALFLVCIEEFSYEQAAKVMHKNVKQITNLIYRGRAMLKKKLNANR